MRGEINTPIHSRTAKYAHTHSNTVQITIEKALPDKHIHINASTHMHTEAGAMTATAAGVDKRPSKPDMLYKY